MICCDSMRKFILRHQTMSCTPGIRCKTFEITACDDDFDIPIVYCPWCSLPVTQLEDIDFEATA